MNEPDHEPQSAPVPDQLPAPPVSNEVKRRLFDVALEHLPPTDTDTQTEIDPNRTDQTTEAAIAQVRRWTTLQESFADAYDAYRSLDLPVPEGVRRIDDLLERSIGFAPNRAGFVSLQLDRLGLQGALDDFVRDEGMWPGDLEWDHDVVWEFLNEHFHLVEGFGGVHGFRR